ncbi:phage tail spike protein [Alkalicoccobacillus porphyridii]|uniref:Tail spike domain-containing protein n=1 Tax=Alkalicoccobacillus porphyridii TaxID=2597270 RepID=A0A554A0A2_9BACI|nr:phage tail spike protein [Alkalicoccobacillus porphyridii]TSB47120.1 hypothetical protein FN960_08890 [Alkalicoccobacillus porphyridii]
MIKVYDRNMRLLAHLKNAYSIGYETPLNEIWKASFSLPLDDPKNQYCKHFNYIELFDGEKRVDLFRIMPARTFKSVEARKVDYQCEHVLACLYDDGIDDYAQWTNLRTEVVLRGMLEYQEVKRWELGRCEITRYFHYGVEKEDLLPTILSVARPFRDPFQWTWDTTVFPWKLNLERGSTQLVGEARWGKNVRGIEKESDPLPMATRIYPYGYGEGVNQLNISKINPTGRRYVENAAAVAEYGIIKYHWVDRRFEDIESMYESSLAKLDELSRPKTTYSVDVVELKALGDLTRFDVGKIVAIIDEDFGRVEVRVRNYKKPDVTGKPHEVSLEIGDKLDDTATTNADRDRRQKTEETYSQGSTNMLPYNYADNCDPQNPAKIRFYLPSDLVNVNTMMLSYQIDPFRAYSRAIQGGGALVDSTKAGGAIVKATESGGATVRSTSSGGSVVKSSGSGGGSQQTSSSGGGTSTSTASGGGTSRSTNSGGGAATTSGFSNPGFYVVSSDPLPFGGTPPYMDHVHSVEVSGQLNHNHTVNVPSHSHEFIVPAHTHDFSTPNHSHTVNIPSHTHEIDIPNHTHSVDIPAHSHEVRLPDHTHEIELPDHTHEIEHGIFEFNRRPSSVQIRVDGNLVPINSTSGSEINIIPYLSTDSGGRIQRGAWHEVTITPNELGRVTADVISRLFIQSRIGGNH